MSVAQTIQKKLKLTESWMQATVDRPGWFTKGAKNYLLTYRHKLLKSLLKAQLKEFNRD